MLNEKKLTMLRLAIYLLLAILVVVTLIPLFWLFCAAFKGSDMFSVTFWSPNPTLDNFRKLFAMEPPFYRYILNSFFLAATVTMIQLFFSSLGGFALAKYKFRFQSLLMIIMLATMMIPSQVLLAPLFGLITKLRLTDTYLGIIIPGSISVFGMFLFRQSMQQIFDGLPD